MKIEHHPDGASLMSYSAGAMPEALAAVMSAHVSVCRHCQERVRQMELIGSVMLEGLEPAPIEETEILRALSHFENVTTDDAALAELDEQVERVALQDPAKIDHESEVPPALQHIIGTSFANVEWSRLGPGVKQMRLNIEGDGDLRLLHIEPGRRLPEHGHGGSELTMVLRGAYHDETGHYKAGDVADLDDDVHHQPIVDEGEPCICIIASDAKIKYKSVVGRILQPIIGM